MAPAARGKAKKPLRVLLEDLLAKFRKRDRNMFFHFPVPKEVPGYYEAIKQPMDLQTIGKKLEAGEYKTLDAFRDDMTLIVDNCRTFNPPGSVYYREASRLSQYMRTTFVNASGRVLPKEEEAEWYAQEAVLEKQRQERAEKKKAAEARKAENRARREAQRAEKAAQRAAAKQALQKISESSKPAPASASTAANGGRKYIRGPYKKRRASQSGASEHRSKRQRRGAAAVVPIGAQLHGQHTGVKMTSRQRRLLQEMMRGLPNIPNDFGMCYPPTPMDMALLWERESQLIKTTGRNANARRVRPTDPFNTRLSGIGPLNYFNMRPFQREPLDQQYMKRISSFCEGMGELAEARLRQKLRHTFGGHLRALSSKQSAAPHRQSRTSSSSSSASSSTSTAASAAAASPPPPTMSKSEPTTAAATNGTFAKTEHS